MTALYYSEALFMARWLRAALHHTLTHILSLPVSFKLSRPTPCPSPSSASCSLSFQQLQRGTALMPVGIMAVNSARLTHINTHLGTAHALLQWCTNTQTKFTHTVSLCPHTRKCMYVWTHTHTHTHTPVPDAGRLPTYCACEQVPNSGGLPVLRWTTGNAQPVVCVSPEYCTLSLTWPHKQHSWWGRLQHTHTHTHTLIDTHVHTHTHTPYLS